MLTLEGVGAAYGLSQVVEDIQLEVGSGETVTLLGRNGVGKTTLLRTIMGLHRTCHGNLTLEGVDITKRSAFERARLGIGYVPQGRGIFPHLTVEENLRLGLAAVRGRAGASGKDQLDSVPNYVYDLFPVLDRFRKRQGGVLSGGEQQQLAIGRALTTRPKLLLFDEPTEGIQPSIVQQIEEAIHSIRKELKIAILLVEQYLDFAWVTAERFYVMRRGRIIEQGKTAERQPQSVAHLLSV